MKIFYLIVVTLFAEIWLTESAISKRKPKLNKLRKSGKITPRQGCSELTIYICYEKHFITKVNLKESVDI